MQLKSIVTESSRARKLTVGRKLYKGDYKVNASEEKDLNTEEEERHLAKQCQPSWVFVCQWCLS